MKARLVVKNFGPIEDVDLDLRSVNVFVGPQASGKSTLAKLYSICKSPLSFLSKPEQYSSGQTAQDGSGSTDFRKALEEYNISSYISSDTYVDFDSELHQFVFNDNTVKYDRKLLMKIGDLERTGISSEMAKEFVLDTLVKLDENFFHFSVFLNMLIKPASILSGDPLRKKLSEEPLLSTHFSAIINRLKELEIELGSKTALYIPSERNFISVIKGASLNLLRNNVSIPKHILAFGAEFEKATSEKRELDLNFLHPGLFYKNENEIDRIYFSPEKSIKLTESSSGLQSIVPLLLPILSKREANIYSHRSYIIEEPELNLFPEAQYKLIKMLETGRVEPFPGIQDFGTIHTYTTHSPYILAAFNNFLYANKVRLAFVRKNIKNTRSFEKAIEYIQQVVPTFIGPEGFSAYQIDNGRGTSIFNRDTSLIEDNYVDQVSDEMGGDFDKLMELMKAL